MHYCKKFLIRWNDACNESLRSNVVRVTFLLHLWQICKLSKLSVWYVHISLKVLAKIVFLRRSELSDIMKVYSATLKTAAGSNSPLLIVCNRRCWWRRWFRQRQGEGGGGRAWAFGGHSGGRRTKEGKAQEDGGRAWEDETRNPWQGLFFFLPCFLSAVMVLHASLNIATFISLHLF